MESSQRVARMTGLVVLAAVTIAGAETHKEYRFTVLPHASISIVNQYGAVSVKPSLGHQVIVTAVLQSNVEVDHTQIGNRVDLVSHVLPDATPETGRVDYEVQAPPDASINLRSSTGPLHAEKLHGDLTIEGTTAIVDVRDVSDAHVHVKTLNGPVTLTNIRDGHVEITSISGDVSLNEVTGTLVQVNSTSGKISYDGDFGTGGRYTLTSHTGDIEAIAPATASIDVQARSVKGAVENDFGLRPEHTSFVSKVGSAFAGTVGKAASSVKLFSFSGKIHLKKR